MHARAHTHNLTNKPLCTWKVTVRNVGPSFWLLPFISCKISLSSWLCEIVAAYEKLLSRPHEFFKHPIALFCRSPRSFRWADGSKLKSSHILLTLGWGEFVCQSSSSWQRNTPPPHTHTHSCSVKNSIKTSKADAVFACVFSPLLFIYRCIPSFIYVQFKVFIKMQRIFAFLTYTSSICQFPPYCTWELSWLVRLCKFVFLCFSLIPSLTSAPGVRLFLSGKNPNIISALAQLHNLTVSVNFMFYILALGPSLIYLLLQIT